MTIVGIFGLVLGLLAARNIYEYWTPVRIRVFALSYLLHVVSAVLSWRLALSAPADASLYYYDPFGNFANGFGLNTQFVIYVVQSIKSLLGGSFLDYYFLFQAVGLWGVAMLMRIFDEVYRELGVEQPIWTYALLLIPSLHFWSSAIGKDAPFFFAAALALWSAMNVRRRFIGFGAGALLMLMIRPHIAILALAALSVTVIADRKTRVWVRIGLAGLALGGVSYAVGSVLGTFNIDLTSADVISDRLAAREQLLGTEEAGRTAVGGSFLVRLFAFLFRPLFYDAEGVLGWAASLENLIILAMLGLMTLHVRQLLAVARAVPFIRYALAFAFALTALLAFEYYNIGLGLRQKWAMLMPNLLVVFVTLQAVRAGRARAQLAGVPPPRRPAALGHAPTRGLS